MSKVDYAKKLSAQIEQYREVQNIHDLPDIFHYWSNKYLRPKLNSVMKADSVVDFYAKPLEASCTTGLSRLLSIGAGDCSLEIGVAKRLLERGVVNFELNCFEVSPHLLERAERSIREAKLDRFVKIHEVDINRWRPAHMYSGVMANHSLHHFVELESIFEGVNECLAEGGVFVTNDMIGRNGHMRWPEVMEFVDHIWAFMPDRYKHNRQLERFEPSYQNWDCSDVGFEGVRAQDILPLLTRRFAFQSFLAFGGIADLFIDRAFGHNFDPESDGDKAFIDFLQLLNDRLIDGGLIKPTTMFAVMRKGWLGRPEVWRHWTPEFCLRSVDNPNI